MHVNILKALRSPAQRNHFKFIRLFIQYFPTSFGLESFLHFFLGHAYWELLISGILIGIRL